MLDVINVLTFAWLTFWAARALAQIARGELEPVLVVLLVFFFFFGLPLFLDVAVGQPAYQFYPGFFHATRDLPTSLLYCAYVSAVPPLWWRFGRAHHRVQLEALRRPLLVKAHPLTPVALWGAVVAPALLWLLSPEPEVYLSYGAVVRKAFSEQGASFYSLVSASCAVSLMAGASVLLVSRPFRWHTLILLLPWATLAVWLNGKRNSAVLGLFAFGFALWQRGRLRGVRLYCAAVLAALSLGIFNHYYQVEVRPSDDLDVVASPYEGFRIDYGRDDRMKMTIFAELHPETMEILEYRGQSLLFYATAFIPRSVWPDKPWTYAVYFTGTLLNIPPRWLGWVMTTSMLEEAVANLGWLGMLVGPLSIALLCRYGNPKGSAIVGALTTVVASLLLAVELVAFWPVVAVWAAALVWSVRRAAPPTSRPRTPESRAPSLELRGNRGSRASTFRA